MSELELKCLLPNAKLQRNLESETGEDVKNILEELLSRSGNDELMQEYLKSSVVVCKKGCFSSLSKLLKLRKESDELERSYRLWPLVPLKHTPSTRVLPRMVKDQQQHAIVSPKKEKEKVGT